MTRYDSIDAMLEDFVPLNQQQRDVKDSLTKWLSELRGYTEDYRRHVKVTIDEDPARLPPDILTIWSYIWRRIMEKSSP